MFVPVLYSCTYNVKQTRMVFYEEVIQFLRDFVWKTYGRPLWALILVSFK